MVVTINCLFDSNDPIDKTKPICTYGVWRLYAIHHPIILGIGENGYVHMQYKTQKLCRRAPLNRGQRTLLVLLK